ncbi:MAG: 2,3-bisphosphoglycerate-dependent phosphoglycerate mutase, partial [Candidatus Dormibacteraceae bacterium]
MSASLILLRHGESEWNALDLFSGWVDVGLTARGEEEAARAAELLLERGLLPWVVHTSVLKRAIRTAEIVLAGLDRQWIPVRRSWRLNERHYGALQGLNKAQTVERHGEGQV